MAEIVVDTNYLITFLVNPSSQLEAEKQRSVRCLFERIEINEATALLPEVVLHETFYTLLGPRFPEIELAPLCTVIAEILAWPGWDFASGDRAVYLRALQILQVAPKLEFSDAVIAARAEAHEAELATFDRRLAEAYGGPIWADS